MRRTTAVLLLTLSLASAFATVNRDQGRDQGGFLGRLRHVIQQIVRHIAPNGDYLTPPKP